MEDAPRENRSELRFGGFFGADTRLAPPAAVAPAPARPLALAGGAAAAGPGAPRTPGGLKPEGHGERSSPWFSVLRVPRVAGDRPAAGSANPDPLESLPIAPVQLGVLVVLEVDLDTVDEQVLTGGIDLEQVPPGHDHVGTLADP